MNTLAHVFWDICVHVSVESIPKEGSGFAGSLGKHILSLSRCSQTIFLSAVPVQTLPTA